MVWDSCGLPKISLPILGGGTRAGNLKIFSPIAAVWLPAEDYIFTQD